MSRFCLDEDMPIALADRLSELGHDAVSAKRESALRGRRDEVVFLFAVRERRLLVTHNEEDFRLLHRAWRLWPLPLEHPGVLVVPQRYRTTVNELATSLDAFGALGVPTANRLFRLLPRRAAVGMRNWEEVPDL